MDSYAPGSRVDLRRVRARSHVYVRLRAAVDAGFGGVQSPLERVSRREGRRRRFARARLRRRAQGDVEGVRSRDAVGDFRGWKRVLTSRRRLRDALGVDATKCGRVGARRESRVVARDVRSTRERVLSRDVVVARSEHGDGHRGRAVRDFTVLPGVFSIVRRLQHQ